MPSEIGYVADQVSERRAVATYELPLAFEVTKASTGEQPQAQRLRGPTADRLPPIGKHIGERSLRFAFLCEPNVGVAIAVDLALNEELEQWLSTRS